MVYVPWSGSLDDLSRWWLLDSLNYVYFSYYYFYYSLLSPNDLLVHKQLDLIPTIENQLKKNRHSHPIPIAIEDAGIKDILPSLPAAIFASSYLCQISYSKHHDFALQGSTSF